MIGREQNRQLSSAERKSGTLAASVSVGGTQEISGAGGAVGIRHRLSDHRPMNRSRVLTGVDIEFLDKVCVLFRVLLKRTGRFGHVRSGDGVAGNVLCARAENGHASAAPPRSGMNSRRLKGLIRMCSMFHLPVRDCTASYSNQRIAVGGSGSSSVGTWPFDRVVKGREALPISAPTRSTRPTIRLTCAMRPVRFRTLMGSTRSDRSHLRGDELKYTNPVVTVG